MRPNHVLHEKRVTDLHPLAQCGWPLPFSRRGTWPPTRPGRVVPGLGRRRVFELRGHRGRWGSRVRAVAVTSQSAQWPHRSAVLCGVAMTPDFTHSARRPGPWALRRRDLTAMPEPSARRPPQLQFVPKTRNAPQRTAGRRAAPGTRSAGTPRRSGRRRDRWGEACVPSGGRCKAVPTALHTYTNDVR